MTQVKTEWVVVTLVTTMYSFFLNTFFICNPTPLPLYSKRQKYDKYIDFLCLVHLIKIFAIKIFTLL